jgi:hypothetical protein
MCGRQVRKGVRIRRRPRSVHILTAVVFARLRQAVEGAYRLSVPQIEIEMRTRNAWDRNRMTSFHSVSAFGDAYGKVGKGDVGHTKRGRDGGRITNVEQGSSGSRLRFRSSKLRSALIVMQYRFHLNIIAKHLTAMPHMYLYGRNV